MAGWFTAWSSNFTHWYLVWDSLELSFWVWEVVTLLNNWPPTFSLHRWAMQQKKKIEICISYHSISDHRSMLVRFPNWDTIVLISLMLNHCWRFPGCPESVAANRWHHEHKSSGGHSSDNVLSGQIHGCRHLFCNIADDNASLYRWHSDEEMDNWKQGM